MASVYSSDAADRRLHLVDRLTREVRQCPLPGASDRSPESGGVYALRFVANERLLSVGDAGLLDWDPRTGASRTLHRPGCGTLDADGEGTRVIVGCLTPGPDESFGERRRSSEVFVFDVVSGARRAIPTHGDTVQAVAIDPSGTLIATGDATGAVRVGRADGSEPYLLLGARGTVTSVDFSPDGRWVAGAIGREVWLWPLPDLSIAPHHAEPLDVLLARLDRLTSLRLVEDRTSSTGYRLTVGPATGWSDRPSW